MSGVLAWALIMIGRGSHGSLSHPVSVATLAVRRADKGLVAYNPRAPLARNGKLRHFEKMEFRFPGSSAFLELPPPRGGIRPISFFGTAKGRRGFTK